MPFKGRKIADIYAELHLDKDAVREGLRGLPGEMGPDADRAGQDLGKRMTDGLTRAVEASSARLAKARRSEQTATDAVKLSELRLSEAREKGGQKASTLLALEQKLEQANRRLTDAQSNTVTSTKKLEDAQHRLATSMGDIGKDMGPRAQKAGDDAGGKLALGMRMSIIRNSPLIVAAIGAGLAAGGPLMMTAATALFAGIGIVAAAQSQKVQSAWAGTWKQVKDGAIADAAVIEPVLVNMAGRVGAGFERMRPQLRGVFADAAPQIGVFTDGILDLAENALPGLVRAVENGMPVTKGFADFLAKTGTGLSDFFDRITAHGPAAGAVWSSLGDSMGTLLPLLGELIGQGAELAAGVLPLVNSGLGITLSIVSALGPALPILVSGFLAMKVAGAAAGFLASFATSAQKAVTSMAGGTAAGDKMSGTLGKVSAAASGGGAGMTALTVGIGTWAAILQYSQGQINKWTAALNEGGDAARKAKADMAGYDESVGRIGTVLDTTAAKTNIFTASTAWAWKLLSNDTDEARKANEEYLAGLTPVEAAQRNVSIAEKALADALKDHAVGSAEVTAAQKNYDAALAASEAASAKLEKAVDGVTQAMIDQANQAMSAIDADFAYQNSLDQLEDKQRALAEAIRDHGSASEEANDAQRAYAEGIWETAQNAAKAAPELDNLEQGTKEYDRAVQNLTLKSLVDLRSGLGPEMQGAVDWMIAKLQAGGASLDELGDKKPKPVVDANIDPLTGKVASATGALVDLDGKRPLPGLDLNTGPFNGKTQTSFSLMDILGGQRPTPVADMNPGPLIATSNWLHGLVSGLDGRRANPVATLYANTSSAEWALNYAARDRYSRVMQTVVGSSIRSTVGPWTGGKIGDFTPKQGFDGGGKVRGPGGPTDDAILFRGPDPDVDYRLSATEWIVKAMSSAKYGDKRMAAVNDGTATVLLPSEMPRGFAGGGRPVASTASFPASDVRAGSIAVENLNVTFSGTGLTMDRQSMRQAAVMLREEIIKLERADR